MEFVLPFLQEPIDDAFWLSDTQAWVYFAVFLFVFIDGFFPVMPGETVVTIAVSAAVASDEVIWPFYIVAFLGAVMGDSLAYLTGRKGGPKVRGWLEQKAGEENMAKARDFFDRQAHFALCVARIPPGIRWAVMFLAGVRPLPYLRDYLPFAAIGAAIWAFQAVTIAALISNALDGRVLVTLAINIVIAFAIAALLGWREKRYQDAHRKSEPPEGEPEAAASPS